jgi:hypothetical protein
MERAHIKIHFEMGPKTKLSSLLVSVGSLIIGIMLSINLLVYQTQLTTSKVKLKWKNMGGQLQQQETLKRKNLNLKWNNTKKEIDPWWELRLPEQNR